MRRNELNMRFIFLAIKHYRRFSCEEIANPTTDRLKRVDDHQRPSNLLLAHYLKRFQHSAPNRWDGIDFQMLDNLAIS